VTRILLLDIETAPNKVYAWGLWDQNISINQIVGSGYVLCWAAKWLGSSEMYFGSLQGSTPKKMLGAIHRLLEEADVVIHYNGQRFDIPTLNKEFIKNGFPPPAPYKQLDLLRVCKAAFRFESNKLDYVSQALAIGAKVKHEGFELWVKCMDGDEKAWARMGRYNRNDVTLLEKLYRRLRPWIVRHPNLGVEKDAVACPKCGSEKVQRRGEQVAQIKRYHRYHCQACAAWFRGNKALAGPRSERGVNIL